MIKAIIFDLSRTLLFPRDSNYKGELNAFHSEHKKEPDYQFLDHFKLNDELLTYLRGIKSMCNLYIFTSGSIQNAPEIKPSLDKIFKKIYSSEDMGLGKKDPEAYSFIAKDIGVRPSEILFVDDSKDNLQAAKQADLEVGHYKEYIEFKRNLERIFKK